MMAQCEDPFTGESSLIEKEKQNQIGLKSEEKSERIIWQMSEFF